MTERVCNRCGESYDRRHGGRLEMDRRDPEVAAYLCPDCYDQMIRAFRERGE